MSNFAPMARVNRSKLHKDLSKQVAEVNRSYKMMKQYVLAGEYVMARNLAEQARLDAFEVQDTLNQVIAEILAFDRTAFPLDISTSLMQGQRIANQQISEEDEKE